MRASSLLPIAALLLAACATQPAQTPHSSTQGSTLVRTGQVSAVRDLTSAGGQTSGVGSFIGGILGGVAGSTIGSGHGRSVAAIGGTLGGGLAGHELEKAGNTRKMTEVSVRYPEGDTVTYQIPSENTLRVGDTVTVSSGSSGLSISPR